MNVSQDVTLFQYFHSHKKLASPLSKFIGIYHKLTKVWDSNLPISPSQRNKYLPGARAAVRHPFLCKNCQVWGPTFCEIVAAFYETSLIY